MVSKVATDMPREWLQAKRRSLAAMAPWKQDAAFTRAIERDVEASGESQFANPFTLEDLLALDGQALRDILGSSEFGADELGRSLQGASEELMRHALRATPASKRAPLTAALQRPSTLDEVADARRHILDACFWELTYWKTPDLYEELTAGEPIHHGVFEHLAPYLRGRTVLDAGAGSGRATFACLDHGAARVYAMEPSPGLRHILDRKRAKHPHGAQIALLRGRFDAVPLPDSSVDVTLSCSAFTSKPEQGGEAGLAELRQVTRPGGYIVIIWPRPEDYGWLAQNGFHYVAMPLRQELRVRFRSLEGALQVVQRFYARNQTLRRYLLQRRRPEVPYSLVGSNPPHDYCWLRVE